MMLRKVGLGIVVLFVVIAGLYLVYVDLFHPEKAMVILAWFLPGKPPVITAPRAGEPITDQVLIYGEVELEEGEGYALFYRPSFDPDAEWTRFYGNLDAGDPIHSTHGGVMGILDTSEVPYKCIDIIVVKRPTDGGLLTFEVNNLHILR